MATLAELAHGLAVPGLPEWTGLLVLMLAVLAALSFLLMPFSVFGVKGRLESVEAQLDEIQSELRQLAMRLPEPVGRRGSAAIQEGWEDPPSHGRAPEPRPLRATPPIPPPPAMPDGRSVRQAPRFR